MKRLPFFTAIATCLVALAALFGTTSYAEILWIDGGLVGARQVAGTYEYQELTFITGEPVLLRGLVALPAVPQGRDSYNVRYAFNLTNTEKNITLQRTIDYSVNNDRSAGLNQTRYQRRLAQYQETITTADGVFTLAEYSYNDSRLFDNTNAVDYYNGGISAFRKYYKNGDFNANEGYVTYEIETIPVVGYRHLWGASETQRIQYTIKSHEPNPDYDPQRFGSEPYRVVWDGAVDVGMSTTRRVTFDYQHTNPQNITFRGNYHKNVREENVLTYSYVLPFLSGDAIDPESLRRNTGTVNLRRDIVIESTPLIAPRIRDISNHWAGEQINLLTSLEIFAIDKEYFVPSAYISRLEFAKAMVNVVNGKLPEPTRTEVVRRLRPGVETPFLDVLPTDPDYHYMQFVKDKNIMNGKNGYFKGDENLTRAEAIAIMVRTLGIQYMAPNPPYKTRFTDDRAIPEWSKDYIYMANEVGLIAGTPEGFINPNALVTKAEAAVMIDNYIKHLKDVINYDYREKVLR